MDMNNRGLLVVLGAFVLVLLLGSGLVGGMMGWAWGFGALMMLVFWAALIGGIILFVRWAAGQTTERSATRQPEDAMTILRRRYAAGEIDQSTFDQMKAKLSEPESKPSQPLGIDGTVGAPR